MQITDDLIQRLEDAKYELDHQVEDHPFAAVGIAFVLGAIFALGPPKAPPRGERTAGNLLTAALTALAIRGVKSYAWSRLSETARGWFDTSSRERIASQDRSVEPFLEH
ncbi:MAG TPA: hypothetical protein VM513_05045 [Kofleriaceae bacterium]|jgi:hypothetical protein|nr:hypothetical protein [Kofleriaceae bacterium]